MSNSPPPSAPPNPPPFPALAGFLSYLIPGLGQFCQGRRGKGVLFFACLYGLFFYGMYLGDWSNVYLPDASDGRAPWRMSELAANLFNRPQFAGQFWIGVAAWPALWQYSHFDPRQQPAAVLAGFERAPSEDVLNDLQRRGDKSWDLAWVYTVIAGVLNILVIYDAAAGPAFGPGTDPNREGAAA